MQSGTAIFQRTWVFILACLLALVAAAPVHAATQRDALVLGSRSDLHHYNISLTAGTYRLAIADLAIADSGSGSSVDMASAQALLVSGDRLLGSVDLTRTTQTLTLAEQTTAELFVSGKPTASHGNLGAWIERTSDNETLFEESLYFSDNTSAPTRTYTYSKQFRFTSTDPVTLSLSDLGAMLAETPFAQFRVTVIKGATTPVLSANIAAEADHNYSVSFTPDINANYWISVLAVAPDAGTSMMGWEMKQSVAGVESTLENQIFQVDDNMEVDGKVLGEFALAEASSVSASAALLSSDVDDFSIAIASVTEAGGSLMILNKTALNQSQVLDAGHYRVILLAPGSTQGLVGIRVGTDSSLLLDTSVSLGNYQPLGELALTANSNVAAGLHVFLQKPSDMEVLVASGTGVALALDLVNPAQNSVAMPAGDYRLWVKSGSVVSDSYYRVHLQPQGAAVQQWWGALGEGLIDSAAFTVASATTGTLSTRNFNLPDALSEEVVVLLAQGNSLIAQFNIDPADKTRTMSGLAIPAGEVQLAVFGKQAAGKASVVGYTLETAAVVDDSSTPPRSANGAGTDGGGGSMSSFILYCLLVMKILRGRKRMVRS